MATAGQYVAPRVELAPGRAAVELHRDPAVGADEHDDARVGQLLELARERRTANRGELEVRKPVGIRDRFSDVGDDLGGKPDVPGGVVELFRVVAQPLVIEEARELRPSSSDPDRSA
jgi:hypothetical protein